MKITQEMIDALNGQFAKEMYSWYLYMAMSSDATYKGRRGAGFWFFKQAEEELSHARKIYDYILDRGGKPEFAQLDKPQGTWDSLKAAFEGALAHEQYISESIIALVKKARELDDTPTEIFLDWFVSEQVEEESTVEGIIQMIGQVGEEGRGLFMIDKELGARQ